MMKTLIVVVVALCVLSLLGAEAQLQLLGLDLSNPSSSANQPVFNVGNIKQDPTGSSSGGVLGALRFDSLGGSGGGLGLESSLNLGNQALGGSGIGDPRMGGGGGGGGGDILGSLRGGGGLGSVGGGSLGNVGSQSRMGQRSFGQPRSAMGHGRQNSWNPLFFMLMNHMFW